MAMYAIGILPLINQLQSTDAKQVWFANDTHGWWQPWTASWVVGAAEQPWPHIWIVCQSQQNMADHERETSANSNTEISEYRSEHHHWRKETPWSCSWLEILCCKLPTEAEQVEGMDIFHPETCIHCQNPTTCCLLHFHTWLSKQVDILPSHAPSLKPQTYCSPSKKQSTSTSSLHALTGRSCATTSKRDLFTLLTRLGGLGLTKPTETAANEFYLFSESHCSSSHSHFPATAS